MRAVADTSFVVALENQNDRFHLQCLAVYEKARIIYLPQSVLNETCYLLTQVGGNLAAVRFLKKLSASNYYLLALEVQDIERIIQLLEKYADSRVDFVDASVAAVAERLNITHVLTLDRRDFNILRPLHTEHFELLP